MSTGPMCALSSVPTRSCWASPVRGGRACRPIGGVESSGVDVDVELAGEGTSRGERSGHVLLPQNLGVGRAGTGPQGVAEAPVASMQVRLVAQDGLEERLVGHQGG